MPGGLGSYVIWVWVLGCCLVGWFEFVLVCGCGLECVWVYGCSSHLFVSFVDCFNTGLVRC